MDRMNELSNVRQSKTKSSLSNCLTDNTMSSNVRHHKLPFTIRLPPEILDKLEEIAKEEERSISSIIRQAIKRYLREREDAKDKI